MKKVLSALVLSAAVVATAGQAYAYGDFKDQINHTLILGMYDKTVSTQVWEIGVNLGQLGIDWNFTDSNKNLLDTHTSVQNALLGYEDLFTNKGAVLNDVRVGMFMQESLTSVYFATTSSSIPTVYAPAHTTVNNGMKALQTKYEDKDATIDGFASLAGKDSLGYSVKLDGTPGNFAGFNNNFAQGTTTIGAIGDADYVDYYLWHFVEGALDLGDSYGNGAVTDYQAVLRFNKEGSVVLNPNGLPVPAPVPVPAAAWLLGSGVLGLFGLRRRK
jgi:hypothetical protein